MLNSCFDSDKVLLSGLQKALLNLHVFHEGSSCQLTPEVFPMNLLRHFYQNHYQSGGIIRALCLTISHKKSLRDKDNSTTRKIILEDLLDRWLTYSDVKFETYTTYTIDCISGVQVNLTNDCIKVTLYICLSSNSNIMFICKAHFIHREHLLDSNLRAFSLIT